MRVDSHEYKKLQSQNCQTFRGNLTMKNASKNTTTTVRVKKNLMDVVRKEARKEDRSVQSVVERLLMTGLFPQGSEKKMGVF